MYKKSRLSSFVTAMVVLLCICIGISAFEVEGRIIKVAWLADMTGPTAESVTPMVWGTQDWFKYVNQDLGGIKGVMVDVIWGDAAYKLDLGLQLYNKFASDKDVVSIHCSTTHINNAIAKKCPEDGLVQYAASPAPDAMYPVKWCYSHSAGYGDQLGAFIDWALSKWPEKRPLRLGLVFMDNPFGKTIYDAGGVNYCKARGVEIVAEEPLPALATDVTVNLRKMSKDKPDYVYYQGTVTQAAIIARDAKKIEFAPKICLSANSVADQFVSVAGENAAEGVMMISWSNPWHGVVPEEMKPGLTKTAAFFKKYRPGQDPSNVGVGYFHGLMGSMITTQAIKLALEKVSPEDLNGKALKELGFDRIANFQDTWELIGPITYTPEDHRGGQYLKIIGVKKGLAYSVTDWLRAPYLSKDKCLWSPHVKSGNWSDIVK
jgi:branched-chain amino acid transport system substrate-binding protein